jgi:tyrosine-protein phosphatase YwqE
MAEQARTDGITTVCATPHIRHDHDVRITELRDRVGELNAALLAADIGLTVLTGGEVASTALEGLTRADLQAVSLGGGGRWILLEPAPGPLDDRLQDGVLRLLDLGFRSVIAHPERHLGHDLVARLRRVIASGALVQATAAYFTEPTTRDGMLELARAGVVHVLGSDSHSSRAGRPVALSAGLDVLTSVAPVAEERDWIARIAPHGIVAGALITPPFGMPAAVTASEW